MVRRAFLDAPEGQIHYRTAGAGRPVLLLHQTPRSSDEYRDVIPILARELRVVAMDTIGYGFHTVVGREAIGDRAAARRITPTSSISMPRMPT